MQSDPALEALTYLLGQFTAINAQTLKAEREAVACGHLPSTSGAKARHLRGHLAARLKSCPSRSCQWLQGLSSCARLSTLTHG